MRESRIWARARQRTSRRHNLEMATREMERRMVVAVEMVVEQSHQFGQDSAVACRLYAFLDDE